MAGLPAGYAEEVASEQPLRGYGRWTDGEYLLLIRTVSYDEVKTKSGKENAHKIEVRVVESKPLANGQPAGVQPVAVGTDIDIFWPDYGPSKVMTKKKVIALVLGLTGLDQKTTDKVEIARTTAAIWDPQVQLARGMLVRATTYRFDLKNAAEDGEEGIGHNFFPVPGENHPHAESVKKRRAELDAERAGGGRPSQPASAAPPPAAAAAPVVPAATTPPSVPPLAPPPAPSADPLAALLAAGWKVHPDDASYLWRGTEVRPKADLLAGR